jgi:hypothetical protein
MVEHCERCIAGWSMHTENGRARSTRMSMAALRPDPLKTAAPHSLIVFASHTSVICGTVAVSPVLTPGGYSAWTCPLWLTAHFTRKQDSTCLEFHTALKSACMPDIACGVACRAAQSDDCAHAEHKAGTQLSSARHGGEKSMCCHATWTLRERHGAQRMQHRHHQLIHSSPAHPTCLSRAQHHDWRACTVCTLHIAGT